MDYKFVPLSCLILATLVRSASIPQVYEDQQNYESQRIAVQQPSYNPTSFNFQEYQKATQQDPQRRRYQQQQAVDKISIPHTRARQEKYLHLNKPLFDDQAFALTQDNPVKISIKQSGWKVVHPKFVTETQQDVLPFNTKEKVELKRPVNINRIPLKSDKTHKDNFIKPTVPSIWLQTPTPTSFVLITEKSKIIKKSNPRHYEVKEKEDEFKSKHMAKDREDSYIEAKNYVTSASQAQTVYVDPQDIDLGGQKVLQQTLGGFVLSNPHQNQLEALNSLLGQNPNAQLQGLNELLQSNQQTYQPIAQLQQNYQQQINPQAYYAVSKDHTPIKEDVADIPNTQTRPNIKIPHTPVTPPAVKNPLSEAILAHSQTVPQNNAQHPEQLKTLQAQLDASTNAHAENLIAQAQQQALEHVQKQHAAIARAQAAAEQNAFAQIHAQNEALVHAHANAEAHRQAQDLQVSQQHEQQQHEEEQQRVIALEAKRQKAEHKLQQEQARARASAHAYKLKQDAASVAHKTRINTQLKHKHANHRLNQASEETQQHFYAHPTPQTYQHEAPTKQIQSHHEVQLVHDQPTSHAYSSGTYGGHEADVTKYFKTPQLSVHEGKNIHGEADLQYASKYAFGYRIRDYHNDFGHQESKDGENTKGHYHVLLPDGRVQNVDYTVDHSGYHAKVSYANSAEQQ